MGRGDAAGAQWSKDVKQAIIDELAPNFITISFQNPKFHSGLNWTIRKGSRYALNSIGVEAKLMGRSGDLAVPDYEVGTAVVSHVLTCAFGDVPPFVFKGIHDTELKNIVLLVDMLKKFYGDISGSDTVTCVGFVILA